MDVCDDELLNAEFEESFAWQRALSRLTEMQGTLYRPNIGAASLTQKSDQMVNESDIGFEEYDQDTSSDDNIDHEDDM